MEILLDVESQRDDLFVLALLIVVHDFFYLGVSFATYANQTLTFCNL